MLYNNNFTGKFNSGQILFLTNDDYTLDANLDGRFDTSDLVAIFQRGEYEDAIAGNSTWSDGDWNCDGDFTTSDLVVALQKGGWSG